jgi:acetone carboxylase gamma subunit
VHVTLSDSDLKKLGKGAGLSVQLPDGNSLVVSVERNGRVWHCKCGEEFSSAQGLNGHVNVKRRVDGKAKHGAAV